MDEGLSLRSFGSKSQDTSQRSPAVKRRVNPELESLRPLTAKLKGNLALCVDPKDGEPSVDAVHDVRTGTRRIEAILDSINTSIQREPALMTPADTEPSVQEVSVEALRDAIARWQRLLRKIRRSAGAVRDLDVHRDLLREFLKGAAKEEMTARETGESVVREDAALGAPAAEGPTAGPLQKQAEDLDAWLRHTRHDQCRPLVDGAKKWMDKLDAHLAALGDALQSRPARRSARRSAAVTALEAFAQLSSEMQQLYAENLHDFRKGAKKARYMAETGVNDEYAGTVGKALKKLQDEIGDWHDWLVLAEEAHRALGDQGSALIPRFEQERERHYTLAMKTSERMRGRLMGEWRASRVKPRHVPRAKTL
jgi:CHAD domain-containing protein